MPVLQRGDAAIHYLDTGTPAGRPDAPTVLFGHGLLFGTWMFRHQIETLSDDYRCVAVDWRGQGESNAPAGDYDMDVLYEDVVALIEQLGGAPVHYAGLSMGGFVGMRLAARRPDLVRSLTLLDTSAEPEDPENVGQYRLLARIYRWLGIGPVKSKVLPIMFAESSLADPDFTPVTEEWIARVKAVGRAGMTKAIRGVTDREAVIDELGAITAPTLVIVGAEDVATPVRKSEAIAARIAGARLEIIADCGHSATLEKPEEVTALIAGHIAAR